MEEIEIDGRKYRVPISGGEKRADPKADQLMEKIRDNLSKQAEEIRILRQVYKEDFRIVDAASHKFEIYLLVRGCPDASLQFEYSSLYPSDNPPVYCLKADWVRENQKKIIKEEIKHIFTENFGRCIITRWVDKIKTLLKQEHLYMKNNARNGEDEEEEIEPIVPAMPVDDTPDIHVGETIKDRGSTFTPYLAKIFSEKDAQKVLEKLNSQSKIQAAWRNTYAYRFENGGKVVEVGEDGGEPKAGRNLLQRLIHYSAVNVLVFLCRTWGGKMLGSDRFKHLNDAADEVLIKMNYKQTAASKKLDDSAAATANKKKNKREKKLKKKT